MARELREVVYVDGVRTAFGRAGPKGIFWRTRADDLGVKVVRELLRRNPELPPDRIDDVVMAATAQVGDQGLTLGRDVALLAGLCDRLVALESGAVIADGPPDEVLSDPAVVAAYLGAAPAPADRPARLAPAVAP